MYNYAIRGAEEAEGGGTGSFLPGAERQKISRRAEKHLHGDIFCYMIKNSDVWKEKEVEKDDQSWNYRSDRICRRRAGAAAFGT